jgi:hypothetical protein
MNRAVYTFVILVGLVVLGVLAYGLTGYFAARSSAAVLGPRAIRLIAQHQGPADLGLGRAEQLLLVEDPAFMNHNGVDLGTPGSGLTTLSQSLGKRVGFSSFRPGIQKIRLIGYAMGLESKLSKQQILALYLDTVWMGPGPDRPIAGFFEASRLIYGRTPAALSDHEFLSLVAVPIAPRKFSLVARGPRLEERVSRIERLVSKKCRPSGLRDVWLDGCAARTHPGCVPSYPESSRMGTRIVIKDRSGYEGEQC